MESLPLGCVPEPSNASAAVGFAVLHPAVDNGTFHAGCSEACDSCFIDHTMHCYAVCHEGCQPYCEKSTAGTPGCSSEEFWSAVPGEPPDCSFTTGDSNSCNKYRLCASEDVDGCPEAYLH
eukprot:2431498-Amphidinium_carterae.1